jgi:hypothetical protein
MSTYIKLLTLEYPRYEGDIRLEHPEILEEQTWPNFPCPDTYALVTPVEIPEFNRDTQCVEEQIPVQIDGVWTQQYLVRDLTTEELEERAAWLAKIQAENSQQGTTDETATTN